mgnify:FL=1
MAKLVTGSTKNAGRSKSTSKGLGAIFSGRVRRVVLNPDDYPEQFQKNGEWSAVAGVFFSPIESPTYSIEQSNFALPLFPNSKQPPTHNEIVYLISLPNPFTQMSPTRFSYYYFQPVNIWNSVHHNAIPDSVWDNIGGESKRNYNETQAGAVRNVTEGDTNISLGETFNEKLSIRPLQLYEGDITYEGRWGNSIRFGSTSTMGIPPNLWSDSGEDGDPIIIIRNGQHEESTEPWVPQVEDINEDKSNVYLTSNQQIPLNAVNTKYSSYDNEPTIPDQYVEPQVILNSSRLIFNAHSDSVLLSAEKSIFLGSNDSINITAANKTVIECDDIKLGNKDATEPIILGNKFLTDLQNLCAQIVALGTALQTPIGAGPPFVPNAAIPVPAVNVTQAAQTMLNKIESYKSKVSKTK